MQIQEATFEPGIGGDACCLQAEVEAGEVQTNSRWISLPPEGLEPLAFDDPKDRAEAERPDGWRWSRRWRRCLLGATRGVGEGAAVGVTRAEPDEGAADGAADGASLAWDAVALGGARLAGAEQPTTELVASTNAPRVRPRR